MKKIWISLVLVLALLLPACQVDGTNEPIIPSPDPDGGDCSAHTDIDDDGYCDDCLESVIVLLDFYAINDLHGKFDDTDECVGVDELTTYLRNAYKTDEGVILLSSGDMWQGSSESNLTKGAIITDWMNELDFASMTLGNHEFDWGTEYISNNAEIAEFPILAINIIEKSTGERPEYCKSSVLVERCGLKIGIIGAIGDCKSSISSSLVTDLDFKVGGELTALVKAESQKLRAEGADFIVYSLHDGNESSSSSVSRPTYSSMLSYYDSVLSDGYVDLVFEGHTHKSYINIDREGVYHLQNGGYDDGISHVEIRFNTARDDYSVNTAEIVKNYRYTGLEDDPSVDSLLEKYEAAISVANTPIGYNAAERNSDFIRTLVADLYLTKGLEKWSEDYNIVLGGGYLSVRAPYYLKSGSLIYGDLMDILPFDNTIVLCSVKGSKLLSQFVNTTNGNYFISYSEYGEQIVNSIDKNATYYIIVDSYSSDYAPNGLTVIDTYSPDVYARDLLADYIKTGALSNISLTTIPEVYEAAESLGVNVQSSVEYYVTGTVTEEPTEKYGNTYITDGDGNTLYIYGIRQNGSLYEALATKPSVGDTVILRGYIVNYKGSADAVIEMKNAELIQIIR